MIIIHLRLWITVSFLTAWISMLIYLSMPASWLCETGERPQEQHLPRNRCPRRLTVLFIGTAVTALLLLILCGPDKINSSVMDSSGGIMEISGGAPQLLPEIMTLKRVLFLLSAELLLLPAAMCDMDYYIIPDQACAGAFGLALLHGVILYGTAGLAAAATGALACGLMMLLSFLLPWLCSGKESIGMGDVKLAASGGALAASVQDPGSWLYSAGLVFVSSVLVSAIWFSALLLLRRVRYGDARPMGPWIVLSVLFIMANGAW